MHFCTWDKDSYTERFLVLLPCTNVFQPEWFIIIWLLHYFPVTFPHWPLSI
jgi:hypothetical protein